MQKALPAICSHRILLLIIVLISSRILHAQSTGVPVYGKDLVSAAALCDWPTPSTQPAINTLGYGGLLETDYLVSTGNPGSNESGSTWYKFTVTQTGTLSFCINPDVNGQSVPQTCPTCPAPTTDGFTWVLMDITSNPASAVSSNQNACNGHSTGMSADPLTQPHVLLPLNVYCDDTQAVGYASWEDPVTLQQGRTYALMINNNSNSGFGFSIWFDNTTARITAPAPAIIARPACGGVVTLALAGESDPTATYTWNWGDGSPTVTGPSPVNHTYATAGPFTPMLTTQFNTVGNCTVTSTTSVTPDLGRGCCPGNIADDHLLGAVGQTVTLAGNHGFTGRYRVLGDLVLTDGAYELGPGTTFYVDGNARVKLVSSRPPYRYTRTVFGSGITVGANASLLLEGATITASGSSSACPMWRGIFVDNSTPVRAGQTYRLAMDNGCTISHASTGVQVGNGYNPQGNDAPYSIRRTSFTHNLRHFRDAGYNLSVPSVVQYCTFDSDPAQMHMPYTQSSGRFYTYEAIHVMPIGFNPSYTAVRIEDNDIHHAVYGIVGGYDDRANVLVRHNTLTDIYQTGIWTWTTLPSVSENSVRLSAAKSLQTEQITADATLVGIMGRSNVTTRNLFEQNEVTGDHADDPTNYKPQVGLSITSYADARGNSLHNLTEGIRAEALNNGDLTDNRFSDCLSGIAGVYSSYNMFQAKIGCNSFRRTAFSSSVLMRGIVVGPQITMNDIGDNIPPGHPAGNLFDGITQPVYNGSTTMFTYWPTASPLEGIMQVDGPGGGNIGAAQAVAPNYCSVQQQATNGNGVNRGGPANATNIAALLDSVRLRMVPAAVRLRYLAEIVAYHRDRQQISALDAWWQRLAKPNAEDYCTVGLYLLRTYDEQRAKADGVRLQAALQPYAALDAEVDGQLRYRRLLPLLQRTPELSPADSTQLSALTWSGTAVAEGAGQWLRYFYPTIALPAPTVSAPALRAAPVAPAAPAKVREALGAAYPNPAQTEVRIAVSVPETVQSATLRFTNLFTGQAVLTVPVLARGPGVSHLVALAALPSGDYAYQLLFDGVPVAGARRLVVLH